MLEVCDHVQCDTVAVMSISTSCTSEQLMCGETLLKYVVMPCMFSVPSALATA
jgi:hypothetical protein